MRTRIALPVASASGALALALQFVVLSPALPARSEYFLTELARAQVGIVSISFMLVAAFALGFYTRTSVVLTGLAIAAVFPAIAVYESARYRGSHNLIPFELIMIAIATVPLMVAAWIGRTMARRVARSVAEWVLS